MTKYCTYIRVSTKKQGKTQLGMDAQRKMCEDYINSHGGVFVKEFQDVESGTHRQRPGLWDAIDYCKDNDCWLVIAKLDRLARDVEFTFKILNTGVQIACVDLPVINTMILGVFATVAQYERELCSGRTRAALNEIKDDIKENGGHVSKAGRWVTKLGRRKGDINPPESYVTLTLANMRRAQDWRSESALYAMVSDELAQGVPRKDILAKAIRLYNKNPKKYCTRKGRPLCEGTLSRWASELQIGI